MKLPWRTLLTLITLLLLAACGGPAGGGSEPQLNVTVDVSALDLEIGEQTSFTVTVLPQGGFSGTIVPSASVLAQGAGFHVEVTPLEPWVISGSQPLTREFTVSAPSNAVPGSYVVRVLFTMNGRTVGEVELRLVVRPEGGTADGDLADIVLGAYHGLAVAQDGSVWAWGRNHEGQLGLPADGLARSQPQRVEGLPDGVRATAVAISSSTSYALLENGTVYSWGDSDHGQLGRHAEEGEDHVPGPVAIDGVAIEDFTEVYAGGYSALARRADGAVFGWGHNTFGQLSTTTEEWFTATPVPGNSLLTGFDTISMGFRHVMGVGAGRVWAWGTGLSNQLGTGATPHAQPAPQEVGASTPIATNVVDVATGNGHTAVALADGTVWSWGANSLGQLGHHEPGATPHQAALELGGAKVVQVVAGAEFTLALLNDGRVLGWGSNQQKQLGPSTQASTHAALEVPLAGKAVKLWAGQWFAYARLEDGSVWAWGDASFGAQGDTDGTGSTGVPTRVNLDWAP